MCVPIVRGWFGLAVLAPLLLLAACAGPRSSELQRVQFEDVPVPARFRLWPDSYGYVDSSVRVGRFDYTGDLSVDEVKSFYRRTMPAYGWSPAPTPDSAGNRLRFSKGPQVCVIEVNQKGDQTHVHVDVEGEVEAR